MPARVVESDELVAPFSESDQQGKQHRTNEEPGRYGDVDGDCASDRAQDKPGRNSEYVENDDLFHSEIVGSHESGVRQEHQKETPAEQCRSRQRCEHEQGPNDYGGSRSQLPGGNGTQAFDRMEAIGISVSDIINEIKAAAQQTEGQRRQYRARYRSRFEQFAAEDETGENDAILEPLGGPHGPRNGAGP
jgi:hypothetical protein